MPRVTVILSTYNWSTVLPYSIGSVARQGYRDWELLVIGDCCTDDSESIVNQTIAENEVTPGRVRWINLPENHGNQFGPNNEGLRQASGELIAYLGHDDLWLPHHLACLVEALDAKAEGGPDLTHSMVRWVDPSIKNGMLFDPSHCIAPSSVMHRRRVTETVGGWRDFRTIVRAPDADLWTRARDAGFQFKFIPRLSVIKFPAFLRRDVYQSRPAHEQKEWFARIGSDPSLEMTELVKMLCASYSTEVPFFEELRQLLWRGGNRFMRRSPQKLPGKGVKINDWRTFKGLEPKI